MRENIKKILDERKSIGRLYHSYVELFDKMGSEYIINLFDKDRKTAMYLYEYIKHDDHRTRYLFEFLYKENTYNDFVYLLIMSVYK